MKIYNNFVNNEWYKASATRDVINPATQEVLAVVAESSSIDVETAVSAARKAFDSGPWRATTAQQRGRILFAMAELIRKHAGWLNWRRLTVASR